MNDRAERDIASEAFASRLIEAGALSLPPGHILHDEGIAGWLGVSIRTVHDQLFRREDGDGVPSRKVGVRHLTTTDLLRQWIVAGAKPMAKNPNKARPPRRSR